MSSLIASLNECNEIEDLIEKELRAIDINSLENDDYENHHTDNQLFEETNFYQSSLSAYISALAERGHKTEIFLEKVNEETSDIFKEEKTKAEHEFNEIKEQMPIKDVFDDKDIFDDDVFDEMKFKDKLLKKQSVEKKKQKEFLSADLRKSNKESLKDEAHLLIEERDKNMKLLDEEIFNEKQNLLSLKQEIKLNSQEKIIRAAVCIQKFFKRLRLKRQLKRMIKELKFEDLPEVYRIQNKEEYITEQLKIKCGDAEDDLEQNVPTGRDVSIKPCVELKTKPLECESHLESIKDLHLGLVQSSSDFFSNPQCLDFHYEKSNINNHFNPEDLNSDFLLNNKLPLKNSHSLYPKLRNESYLDTSEPNEDMVLNYLVSNSELHLKSAQSFVMINLNPAKSRAETTLLNPLVLSKDQDNLELRSGDLHFNALLSCVDQNPSNILKTYNDNEVDKQDNIEESKLVNNEKTDTYNDNEVDKQDNIEESKLVNNEKPKPVNNEKTKLVNDEKALNMLNVLDSTVLQNTQGDVIIASKLDLFSNVSPRIVSLCEEWLIISRSKLPEYKAPIHLRSLQHKTRSEVLINEEDITANEPDQVIKLNFTSSKSITYGRELSEFTNLQCLSINGVVAIESINMKSLVNLKLLIIQKCSFEVVVNLTSNLRFINLSNNKLTSLLGFDSLVNLFYLDLSNNLITRLSGLESCSHLTYLNLDDNQLISTKGLQYFNQLTYLSCRNNQILCVDEVQYCPLLKVAFFCGNNLSKVPQLRNNVLLYILHMNDNNISSINDLSMYWLPNLSILALNANNISSVPLLENLMTLKEIHLDGNLFSQLKDLTGLSACKHLTKLSVKENPISSVSGYRSSIHHILPYLKLIDGEEFTSETEDIESLLFNEVQIKEYNTAWEHIETDLFCFTQLSNDLLLKKLQLQINAYSALLDILSRHFQISQNIFETCFKKNSHNDLLAVSCSLTQENETKRADSAKKIQRLFKQYMYKKNQLSTSQKNLELNGIYPEELNNCVLLNKKVLFDNSEKLGMINSKTELFKDDIKTPEDFGSLENYNRNLEKDMVQNDDDSNDSDFDYTQEVNVGDFEYIDIPWNPPEFFQQSKNSPNLSTSHFITSKQLESGSCLSVNKVWDAPASHLRPVSTTDDGTCFLNLSSTQSKSTSSQIIKKANSITKDWGFLSPTTTELVLKRARKMGVKKKKDLDPYERFYSTKRKHDAILPSKARDCRSTVSWCEKVERSLIKQRSIDSHIKSSLELRSFYTGSEINHHSGKVTKHNAKSSVTRINEPLTLPKVNTSYLAGRSIPLMLSEVCKVKPNREIARNSFRDDSQVSLYRHERPERLLSAKLFKDKK